MKIQAACRMTALLFILCVAPVIVSAQNCESDCTLTADVLELSCILSGGTPTQCAALADDYLADCLASCAPPPTATPTHTPTPEPTEEPVPEAPQWVLDIRPGDGPNPINRRSRGLLPAALLGVEGVDWSTVDLDSLVLVRLDEVGGGALPAEKRNGRHIATEDVSGDGVLDLVMQFETQQVIEELELDDLNRGDVVELMLLGQFLDGTAIVAVDQVWIVK